MNSTYLSQSKIFNHLDRVQAWLKGKTCFPITIQIDPTNRCTRNCLGCSGNKTAKNAQLSLKFMKGAINQIAPFCKGLIFTGGGEPLCNDDTLSAIKYARAKGLEVGLVTNADLLNADIAKGLVRHCTYIRISCNYVGAWNKIKLLVKARNKQKSACTIGIGFLTNKERAAHMKEVTEIAKKLKVDYVQFRPFHLDTFDAGDKIARLKENLDSATFKVIATDYKYKEMSDNLKKVKKHPVCFGDNFRTVIAADGKLYPDCFTRGLKNFCLGDLQKESFKKIWASEKRKKIFKSKLDISNCPPMCYHDPLDELLWNIWQQYKGGKHVNFI